MPKRRHSRSIERLEEEIIRLKRRLRRRSRSFSSSSRSPSPWRQRLYKNSSRESLAASFGEIGDRSPSKSGSESPVIVIEAEEETATTDVPGNKENLKPVESDQQAKLPEEDLSESILALLGEAPEEIKYGPKLLTQLSTRWQDIIKNGMKKEERERLIKKYPAPENPPKMNPEAQAAAGDALVSRDKAIEAKQRGVSSALSALGIALSKLCKTSGQEEAITLLNDSSRLLCEYLNKESQLRRGFIISGLESKTAREALRDTNMDQWLFGENLAEKLKASKAIQQSCKDLRGHKNKHIKTNTSNLNFKGPANNTYKPKNDRKQQYRKKTGAVHTKTTPQRGRNQRHYSSRHYLSRH